MAVLRRVSVLVLVVATAAAAMIVPASAASIDSYEPGSCIDNGSIAPESFVDVSSAAFYGPAVAWAADNAVVNGISSTHFSPEATMSRGEFAAVLHRSVCNPAATGSADFTDLQPGAFYLDAVNWLVGEDLTTGITPTEFGPARPLTRGEFVTFLFRLVGEPAGSPRAGFSDVLDTEFFADAIDWAKHRGVTTGVSATTFSPWRPLTRGEAVTFLYRLNTIGNVQAEFETLLSGLDNPVAMAQNPSTGSWFIAQQSGTLIRWTGSGTGTATVLTQSVSQGNEQGLLGVTFTADGTRLYVSYTDTAGRSVIDEYVMAGDAPDTGTRREIIRVSQPASNHNGGDIHIGPDGYLYFGLGDGGGRNDPSNNGQNTNTLLGSILRIDPANPANGNAYGIPLSNPFFLSAGLAEIWAYGVRNPWRFSFDQATGDLWVADVGQDAREEITRLTGPSAGREVNLGWRLREGNIATPGVGGAIPAGYVGPVHDYGLSGGQSITGGYVYRGSAIPSLDGVYLWADYFVSNLNGWRDAYGVEDESIGAIGGRPTSFGQDADGEVYVLTANGLLRKLVSA